MKRQLEEIIKRKEYKRLPECTKNKMITKDNFEVKDFVPNPILIRNKNNIEIVTENVLQKINIRRY